MKLDRSSFSSYDRSVGLCLEDLPIGYGLSDKRCILYKAEYPELRLNNFTVYNWPSLNGFSKLLKDIF